MCMEAVLVREGHWDLIMEDLFDVEDIADENEKKAMKKQMAEARAAIILRVEDSQLAHMTNRNPKTVWDTLANVHQARGFGSRLQLRRHFITATIKEGQSMESWIGEVRSLSNRLTAINVKVTDEDMIVVLTASLPSSYTPVVVSFDGIDPGKLTLDFVITRLLNEESRQSAPSSSGAEVKPEDNAAMLAKRAGPNITCFYCGEKGHYAINCPHRKKSPTPTQTAGAAVANDSWWDIEGTNVAC